MKYFKFKTLENRSEITLILPNITVNGYVIAVPHSAFLAVDRYSDGTNRKFFDVVGIKDPEEFLKSKGIRGSLKGAFPEVESIEELHKVLELIEDFYDCSLNNTDILTKEFLRINKEIQDLYNKCIRQIFRLNKVSLPMPINLSTLISDPKIDQFCKKEIYIDNYPYTIQEFACGVSGKYIYVELKKDGVSFLKAFSTNKENISKTDVVILINIINIYSYILDNYSYKSILVKSKQQ